MPASWFLRQSFKTFHYIQRVATKNLRNSPCTIFSHMLPKCIFRILKELVFESPVYAVVSFVFSRWWLNTIISTNWKFTEVITVTGLSSPVSPRRLHSSRSYPFCKRASINVSLSFVSIFFYFGGFLPCQPPIYPDIFGIVDLAKSDSVQCTRQTCFSPEW